MGKAAGRGDRPLRGMGKFKRDAFEPELPGLVRWTNETQEDQNGKHRDAGYDNHRRPWSF